jgi:hypothetical protein
MRTPFSAASSIISIPKAFRLVAKLSSVFLPSSTEQTSTSHISTPRRILTSTPAVGSSFVFSSSHLHP